MTKPCILIMAGGTGGHVFPALVVAQKLQEAGWEVHWLGTQKGLEAKIVPNAHFPLHIISVKGLRRSSKLAWVLAPFQIVRAIFQISLLILKLKPTLALGMGGFVSGPGGLAAWVMRCPLIIHEQNAIVGMTNHYLAPFATRVLEGFPGAFKAKVRAIFTGNPIRSALLTLPPPKERFKARSGPLRLLVLGGSRGASALNQICPLALLRLPLENRPEIWHQAGGGHEIETAKAYQSAQVLAKVEPFIEDMTAAYSWADLVLCRAGALTVGELAAVGVPSILVPFPFAVDDHQTFNGRFLEKVGAAKLISQSLLTAEKLADTLLEFSDREHLLKMAENAYAISKRDALATVVTYCQEVANKIKFKEQINRESKES